MKERFFWATKTSSLCHPSVPGPDIEHSYFYPLLPVVRIWVFFPAYTNISLWTFLFSLQTAVNEAETQTGFIN